MPSTKMTLSLPVFILRNRQQSALTSIRHVSDLLIPGSVNLQLSLLQSLTPQYFSLDHLRNPSERGNLEVESARMSLRITHASESDIDRLMEVQFAAMAHEPYHHVLFPGPNTPQARAQAGARTLQDWRNDPSERVLEVIDTESGKIVSFGKWNIYASERPESEWNQHLEVDWTKDPALKEGAETYLRGIHGMRHKYATGQPHLRKALPLFFFLFFLFVNLRVMM